ncbi:MAG TPA: type II toxin-antitoxin system RelE/ParE family toxin [Treponemataceae bacterium]|nr:type II toxin-antitoxin system RelE/ParE family toxin [Treponemataceae bacterium]
MPAKKKISVVFYKTPVGNEPVREWLKALSSDEKKSIGEDIKAVELAWPIGIPLVRKLDVDLWEVRTKMPNKISRVFFTVWKGFMVLLHGIIKKSQKTPKEDLDLAKKRRNYVLKGGLTDEK